MAAWYRVSGLGMVSRIIYNGNRVSNMHLCVTIAFQDRLRSRRDDCHLRQSETPCPSLRIKAVGEPPRRQERALVSLSKSTASVVSVCRSPRWIIARVSGIQAGPRANGREPALQGAWSAWCKKAELSDPADSETTKEAPQCRVCITSSSMSSIDLFIQTTHPVRCIHSLSMASAAANFRSVCGSERGAPECSTQRSPAAAPHLGQGTEDWTAPLT